MDRALDRRQRSQEVQGQDQQRQSREHRAKYHLAGPEDAAEDLLDQVGGGEELLRLADHLEAVVEGPDLAVAEQILQDRRSRGDQVGDLLGEGRHNGEAR